MVIHFFRPRLAPSLSLSRAPRGGPEWGWGPGRERRGAGGPGRMGAGRAGGRMLRAAGVRAGALADVADDLGLRIEDARVIVAAAASLAGR